MMYFKLKDWGLVQVCCFDTEGVNAAPEEDVASLPVAFQLSTAVQ
jgi:hypothetical protein